MQDSREKRRHDNQGIDHETMERLTFDDQDKREERDFIFNDVVHSLIIVRVEREDKRQRKFKCQERRIF
jgi:hypothetical protein